MSKALVRRISAAGVLLCTLALGLYALSHPAVFFYERAVLFVRPSAEKALFYGNRHLSSTEAFFYDIDKAEHFFERAREIDAEYPYVHHQLGRIAFLRSDFVRAIEHLNTEISLYGDEHANSYYVRGLIKGYAGMYDSAARDYKHFLDLVPPNWAGITDYAWVLLKAERFEEAAAETERGLEIFPDNAWLLSANAIALFELGEHEKALERAKQAVDATRLVTEDMWLSAYPGNDPRSAAQGLFTLRKSALDNMHMIEATVSSGAVE